MLHDFSPATDIHIYMYYIFMKEFFKLILWFSCKPRLHFMWPKGVIMIVDAILWLIQAFCAFGVSTCWQLFWGTAVCIIASFHTVWMLNFGCWRWNIPAFWMPIPCLLMPCLLKSPEHQQTWCWQCKTNNIYRCSKVNFIYLVRAKSKIWFEMWIYVL